MKRSKRIAWTLAALSGVLLAASSATMALRVAAFHRENKRMVYAFQAVTVRQFEYAGHAVTITDDDDPSGERFVLVRYGGDSLRLRVTVPGDRRLPGLLGHEDWLRVLRFASATGKTLDELRAGMQRGDTPDRLVIVTRTPEPGAEPSSWGEVNQRAWKFDFYEFRPEGGFDHERKAFPVKRRVDLRTGVAPPAPEDELKENTWEYQAALMVMPPARGPSPQFTNDGLHAMGWTLPATSTSMLVFIAALVVAVAPERSGRGKGEPGEGTENRRAGG